MAKITRRVRIVIISLAIASLLVLIFFGGRYVLYTQIRKTIESELYSLRDQEIFIEYDHLDVHPWQGKIELFQLTVKVRKDKTMGNGLDATLPYALIEGIDVIPFIRDKTLTIKRILIREASATYASGATLFESDSTQKRKIEVRNISVKEIDLPDIDLFVRDTLAQDTLVHLLTSVRMNDILLRKQLDSLTWQKGIVLISDVAMKSYPEQYGLSVKLIRLGIEDRSISIDSIRFKPVLGKIAFMKYKGREDDYLNGLIPTLKITGINWFVFPKAVITAQRISTTFHLEMYRDKRFPFLQFEERRLPSHMLQDLPFEIKIDTVLIKDSYVSYEEHPEEGDHAGAVFFDQLYATILNIHNTPKTKEPISMDTQSRFMGTGELKAQFTFPYDTLKPYSVSGTLQNMPLEPVNQMLIPAAKAKIESGVMNKLSFNFTYTKEKSSGEVELHYEGLKVLTLRENKKDEEKVSRLKTLLLNTFIIKRDMNEDTPDDKRKGEIDFERDHRRSVFNYWWKSILSGLKSAYNLDKLPIGSSPPGKKDGRKRRKITEVASNHFK